MWYNSITVGVPSAVSRSAGSLCLDFEVRRHLARSAMMVFEYIPIIVVTGIFLCKLKRFAI